MELEIIIMYRVLEGLVGEDIKMRSLDRQI